MLFIFKTAKTIRNNWKKTAFATCLVSYGVVYTKNHFETQELMRSYCKKAAQYGKQSIPLDINPRHVTVILNPNANKRKATEDFEKYCAPLLHLAGISIDIKRTEAEGHAKTLINGISGTDAIVVAGGDGTLSEVVTGLLRISNENTSNIVPLGILPLGKSNSIAKAFFPSEKRLEKVRCLADATMAVIEESVKQADVIKIEVIQQKDKEEPSKAVYAVGSLKWGAYRDAEAKKDSYWVFGPLRKYATYIFNGMKNSLSWNCEALINYSVPCEGCSNCVKRIVKASSNTWLQRLVREDNPQAQYLSRSNPECQIPHEKKISTVDFELLTTNIVVPDIDPPNREQIPKFLLKIGPSKVEYFDFVRNGFKMEKGEKKDVEEIIEAKSVNIEPESCNNKEGAWFSIDNEYYEVKPVRITLLPRTIKMFCKKESINL